MNKILISCLISMALVYSLSNCSTVDVFEYQNDSRLDEVYIKTGVDFSHYHSIMIDAISVWYPDQYSPSPENVEKARANLARAQDLFRQTIREALADRYSVTDKPGKDVLRIHAEFVDLRAIPQGGDIPVELARYDFETKPGHITLVAQLLDSQSGDLLARAADVGQQESIGGDGLVNWDAISSDFDYWAEIFRTWLDEVHASSD